MTSSMPVNTRGQSDRNGYALTVEKHFVSFVVVSIAHAQRKCVHTTNAVRTRAAAAPVNTYPQMLPRASPVAQTARGPRARGARAPAGLSLSLSLYFVVQLAWRQRLSSAMPGIYGFDHMVVRVEDFNVGMGDMGMLPGLELREVGESE